MTIKNEKKNEVAADAAAVDFLGLRVLTPLEEEAVGAGTEDHDHSPFQHHDHVSAQLK